MISFKNSRVYVENKGIITTSLTIKDGKFYSFSAEKNAIELDKKFIIVPGFIDQHVHGANGSDFMDLDNDGILNISKSFVQDGVTSFLATTMTMEEDRLIASLKNIANYKNNEDGATLLGIHLEGPFISKDYCGAQDPKYIQKPTKEQMMKYLEASNNLIKIVSFAPEEANDDFYQLLNEKNIYMSAGHTAANCEDIKKAINKGLKGSTHTFNAMKGIHHRDIGTCGMALLDDSLCCELICDLFHVSEDAIRLLVKTKTLDKIVLITDSMEAKYLSKGNYSLGGQKVIVDDNIARLETGVLAGSILRLNKALKNMKDVTSLALERLIDMVTLTPAKNLDIDSNKGSINISKDADFVIIDEDFNVYQTYINGRLVYAKEDLK